MILEKNSFNYLFNRYLKKIYVVCIVFMLFLQHIFYAKYSEFKPELEVVERSFNLKTMKAFVFGDEQFYFRIKALKVQNMGDTRGRFTSFSKYNYKHLYEWLDNLDTLDTKSNYLASLSSYYFSQTQNIEDRRYPIIFLDKFASRDIEKKWWWLYQASFLAKFSLKDIDLSVKLMKKLEKNMPKTAPYWLKQLVVLYLLDGGEDCESLKVFDGILTDYNNIMKSGDKSLIKEKEVELNFMSYFINSMSKKMRNKEITFKKCSKYFEKVNKINNK